MTVVTVVQPGAKFVQLKHNVRVATDTVGSKVLEDGQRAVTTQRVLQPRGYSVHLRSCREMIGPWHQRSLGTLLDSMG
jgi:hypothetical protein